MKHNSVFGPLILIATGVIWLLVSMNVIPAANLWALTHIWPFVLIALGLGLLLSAWWSMAGRIVSALVVIGAFLAVIYAPQLGWAGGPNWDFDPNFTGGVSGSGKIKTETRDVKDFLAISIEYPAEVVVQQGATESVKVEADDNLLPQLSTEVRDGKLIIENNERDWSKRVNSSETITITITVKDLREIDLSSAGALHVNGLKTDELTLVLSGAGEMTLKELDLQKFDIILSGAGDINADGTADEMNLRISGFGSFDGKDLEALKAEVHITGAGDAHVRVKNDLTASVSGAGSINYYGSPHVVQNISGAGSVKQAGK
jgi:hypothetical protein